MSRRRIKAAPGTLPWPATHHDGRRRREAAQRAAARREPVGCEASRHAPRAREAPGGPAGVAVLRRRLELEARSHNAGADPRRRRELGSRNDGAREQVARVGLCRGPARRRECSAVESRRVERAAAHQRRVAFDPREEGRHSRLPREPRVGRVDRGGLDVEEGEERRRRRRRLRGCRR